VELLAPGAHSFINAIDFESPQELAKYIKKVDSDEVFLSVFLVSILCEPVVTSSFHLKTLYQQYHTWRNGPVASYFNQMHRWSIDSVGCRACLWVAKQRLKELSINLPPGSEFTR